MQRFLALILLVPLFAYAQITDDFSQGDWRRFENTPGTLTAPQLGNSVSSRRMSRRTG